jgi:hypothetical protein
MSPGDDVSAYRRLSDRRGRLRFELVGERTAALRIVEVLAVKDLSRKGALVESAVALPVESVHTLRLETGDVSGEVTARVRHVTAAQTANGSARYRIGFEFLDLQSSLGDQLGRLLKSGLDASADS